MGKFIKTALVFVGGMTIGGYCIVNAALNSQTFTTALEDALTKKIAEVLYGEESQTVKHRVSRYGICPSDCSDIIFRTREDAERVLSDMEKVIEQHSVVTLADVYDIAGQVTSSYSASKYGWRSFDNAKIVRCRAGYFIDVPKATEIR